MSLGILVWYRDKETNERVYVDLGPGGNMAGVEQAREKLWGAPVMTELGLLHLPQLREYGDLIFEGEYLEALEREAQTVLDNVDLVAAHTNFRHEVIEHRATNLVKAARAARAVNGYLSISG